MNHAFILLRPTRLRRKEQESSAIRVVGSALTLAIEYEKGDEYRARVAVERSEDAVTWYRDAHAPTPRRRRKPLKHPKRALARYLKSVKQRVYAIGSSGRYAIQLDPSRYMRFAFSASGGTTRGFGTIALSAFTDLDA